MKSSDSTSDGVEPAVTRRAVLTGAGAAGLLGLGMGTATPDSADPDSLRALYAQSIGGTLTGGTAVTSLTGPYLDVEDGSLSAADAFLSVDDGSTSVAIVDEITVGDGLSLTDDGDGTVTVER